MRAIGWMLVALFVVFLIWSITAEILADYEYDNSIGSYWSLSVKASTLAAKADYLDKFVKAVDAAQLTGNDAIFLKTPDNGIEQNLVTLHSLQTRMNEIRGMDVTSFAYQQAISQITAQEQDEASNLLGVIKGVWYLKNHSMLWGWVDFLKWALLMLIPFIGAVLIEAGE
jgi:hypothetical protein